MTLPNKPLTRQEQYLSKIAGENTELPDKPLTREEMYLDEIAKNGGGGGTSDFDQLSNRPQLNGVAMTGNTNITNFTGTDGTNAGAQGLVPAPAAADADKFLKSDGTWATAGGGYVLPTASSETLGGIKVGNNLSIDANGVLSALGGGGDTIKTLTADDYNWNSATQSATEPFNSVALWLLDPGFYRRGTGVTVYFGRMSNQTIAGYDIVMVGLTSSYGKVIGRFYSMATSEAGFEFASFYSVSVALGIVTGSATVSQVIDDLYSDYTDAPLSANQGRILGERSNIIEASAPTTETEGVLGQLYTDTSAMHTYQCTNIDDSGDDPVYTWTQRW